MFVYELSGCGYESSLQSLKTSEIAPVLSKEFLDIQATTECGFTLKRASDMIRPYRQDPDSYYPTLDESDKFSCEPIQEAATTTTTHFSTTLSAPPVSSMIPFEAPVPVTNVIPSPAVSISSSQSVPASINAVPRLKNASISTRPASSVVIHAIPSHKCPICKEMYIKTDIEAHVDIFLEKTNSMSYNSFTSFAEKENFSRKDKKVLNVRRNNLVKDVLGKCKLFFREGITPIHVTFVQDPNTIDAVELLRDMFKLYLRASVTVFVLQKRKSVCI